MDGARSAGSLAVPAWSLFHRSSSRFRCLNSSLIGSINGGYFLRLLICTVKNRRLSGSLAASGVAVNLVEWQSVGGWRERTTRSHRTVYSDF